MLFCSMNAVRNWYILPIFFITSFISKGQNGALIPDTYDQFFQNYYLINPANTDTAGVILHMGHKSQLGVFRGVRQTYFDANFRIQSNRLNRAHSVGIQLFNNSEGDFFSKNRVYGRYAFDIHLSETYFLSAGIAVGAVSYAFKATQSSAGGSDLAYDGSTGLWVVGRKLKAGVSIQQISQGKLSPLGQIFELRRQYNANVSYLFFINPDIQLTTHVWYKHQQHNMHDVQVAAIITLQNLVEFGGNYKYQKGVVLIGGLKDIHIGTSRISLAMSYSTGILNYLAKGDNAVEIFLRYSR